MTSDEDNTAKVMACYLQDEVTKRWSFPSQVPNLSLSLIGTAYSGGSQLPGVVALVTGP